MDLSWLWGGLSGAVLTAGGFLINRWIIAPRDAAKAYRARRLDALGKLGDLLALANDSFKNQNAKARALLERLQSRKPDFEVCDAQERPLGFDEVFHRAFASFDPGERELFDLIRGSSMVSMLNVNRLQIDWLRENYALIQDTDLAARAPELQKDLIALRAHLQAWLDKYLVWIPDHPTRSLVYLDDEKHHGPGFPHGIDTTIQTAIRALGA